MDQQKGLTPTQLRAIHALLSEKSIKLAAQKAGVGYSTLRSWKDHHPTFRAALAEACQKLRAQLWEDVSQRYHLPPPKGGRQ